MGEVSQLPSKVQWGISPAAPASLGPSCPAEWGWRGGDTLTIQGQGNGGVPGIRPTGADPKAGLTPRGQRGWERPCCPGFPGMPSKATQLPSAPCPLPPNPPLPQRLAWPEAPTAS